MSKIVKLSKSDWMKIGVEAGYIKGASMSDEYIMLELLDNLENLRERIDGMRMRGELKSLSYQPLHGPRSAAFELSRDIKKFMRMLDDEQEIPDSQQE